MVTFVRDSEVIGSGQSESNLPRVRLTEGFVLEMRLEKNVSKCKQQRTAEVTRRFFVVNSFSRLMVRKAEA